MKRIITFFLLVAMAIGGVKAQKGMQQIGVSYSLTAQASSSLEAVQGAGLNYLYNLTDNIAIEPAGFAYFTRTSYSLEYMWLFSLSGIYYFGIPKVCRPYGKVGISYEHIANTSIFEPLFGIGLNARLLYHMSIKPEIQCIITDFRSLIVMNLGFTYNF